MVKYTRWICGAASEEEVSHLTEAGYPDLVACVLAARGMGTVEEASQFLSREHRLS